MKKIIIAGFAVLTFAACTFNRPDYGDTLQPWIGQSEERLQQSWGMPQDVLYVTPNEKEVTYVRFSSHPQDGITQPYGNEVYYPAIATPDFGFPNQPQYSTYYCKTSFTIRNGVVIDYSFNGDDCIADS